MSFAQLQASIMAWLPALITVVVGIAILIGVRWLLDFRARRSGGSFSVGSQALMLVLTAIAVIAVVLVLPIGDTARGQLLSLLGILLTAAVALSSTTFVGNAMAGLMLRAVRSFEPGDFVRIGDHFGRVSDKGLLHTEIQTEDRDLTTIPNLHLVTHPVTVVSASGTVLSATVSLGYDVPRPDIEACLLEAARAADLKEPFVQVVELGDFSVTYRIAGFLEEVKLLLSARSRLRGCMLDSLHRQGIEIVSPNFMNQRVLSEETRVLPGTSRTRRIAKVAEAPPPETRIFDKAEQAEARANLEKAAAAAAAELESLEQALDKADEAERPGLQQKIGLLTAQIEQLSAELRVPEGTEEP